MKAYYNDHDKNVCAWLEQLIKNGDITKGDVDDRSITEVTPSDIAGYDRVHLFAGVGTWDYSLNCAGWSDRPVWTASLPCQPFSAAGKGLGKEDERHLLPHFLELVKQCRPHTIFGEQVERAIKHGWLDDLQTNMEAEGYAVGHCVLGAHSVNAAHIRQRLYWVAHAINDSDKRTFTGVYESQDGSEIEDRQNFAKPWKPGGTGANVSVWLGNAERTGLERHVGHENSVCGQGRERSKQRRNGESYSGVINAESIEWIYCRDNKYRPIKSCIKPLVTRTAGDMVRGSDTGSQIEANNTQEARAMRLKGYGNAIQAQTAEAFIRAFVTATFLR